MTIAAKLFLTSIVLVAVLFLAIKGEPKGGYSGRVATFLGFLVVVTMAGVPASAIAWIWGW